MRKHIVLIVIACLPLMLASVIYCQAQTVIEPGSVLNITVLGSTELSQTVIVKEDGTTDYPVLGGFKVSGLTSDALVNILTRIVSHIVDRPKVFVTISEYSFITARVKGAVRDPGEVVVKAPADIIDVIAESGGTTDQADLRRVIIVSESSEEKGKQRTIVNLVEYSNFRDEGYEPLLVNIGDLIVVPTLEPDSYVRVLGEVRIPGSYVPEQNTTIVDLIYQAGGPTRDADLETVSLIHRKDSEIIETKYDIRTLLSDSYDLPMVEPGDIVIVAYKSEYRTFRFWVNLTRDLAILATSIVLMQRI